MKNFFLLLLFPFIVNAQNNSDDIKENDWLTDYANAQVVAKKPTPTFLCTLLVVIGARPVRP